MENLEITATSGNFHIEGFPDAVKLLRIEGPKVQRLADLSLHKDDLEFALECLEQINKVPDEPWALRQALWRSAVVYYIKCFGANESRFSLVLHKVYKGDAGATRAHKYFDGLRNKHLVHDENSYSQCLPGAVLNKRDMDCKIAKIICMNVISETLSQDSYSNLRLLILRAREWVVEQFDQLCNVLSAELETERYEALLARQDITCTAPGVDEIHKPRNAL